jgi:hypothetical protein
MPVLEHIEQLWTTSFKRNQERGTSTRSRVIVNAVKDNSHAANHCSDVQGG